MTNEEKSKPILYSDILGKNNKNHILILHGLYGCSDNWLSVGNFLASDYCVHMIDMRNHGKSFHDSVHNYPAMADDIKNYIDHHSLNKISIIGHSMGGKIAMFFAEKYQKKLDRLIVIDISPRNYKSLMEIDHNVNFHLNMLSEIKNLDISKYSSYSEVENSLTHLKRSIRNIILKNLQKENGKFVWKINIDAIFNNFGEIFKGLDPENFIDSKIETMTLFIKGENSDYIESVDKKIIDYIFSNSGIIEIEGTGHWIHVDQPSVLKTEIKNFLNS